MNGGFININQRQKVIHVKKCLMQTANNARRLLTTGINRKIDICESRHLTPEQFDRLVNNEVIFLAQQAKENGLVDSLGRWDKMKELVKNETGK